MGDFRYWLTENRGTLLAVLVFVIMFGIYTGNHSAGFSGMVVTTAANKGVLLALVAMAQTLVVLTAGIDLSVGMIFVLANCLASQLVVGSALETGLGVSAVLLAGILCGALNGLIVIYGTCSRSSPRWRPAPCSMASPCGCGRSRAATSIRISPMR